MTLKSDGRFEEELTCCMEKDMKNFENFHQSTQSVKTATFMGLFCPKQKVYELKIYKGVMTIKNDTKMCHDNED